MGLLNPQLKRPTEPCGPDTGSMETVGTYQPLATALAEDLLADQPDRLAHTLAVGERMMELAEHAGWIASQQDIAGAIGVLHDIGYGADKLLSPSKITGHHGLDGGTILFSRGGVLADFAPWVIWHSTSPWQAAVMGLAMPEPSPADDLLDLLWVADFTTSPTGEPVTLEERITNILGRYRPNAAPVVALLAAEDEMRTVFARVKDPRVQPHQPQWA